MATTTPKTVTPVYHISDFDEEGYLIAYPDIKRAVAAGHFESGWEHYNHPNGGRKEGRDPNPDIPFKLRHPVLLQVIYVVAAIVAVRVLWALHSRYL